MLRCLVLLAFLPFLTACGPEIVYEEATVFADGNWAYADSVNFNFEVTDVDRPYDLDLTVSHGTDFAYQNFYVRVHTTFPSGKRETSQSSLQLAGDFGAWRGDCSGEHCTLSIPMLTDVRFEEPGAYAITVEQFSRDEPLAAIDGVGLRLSVSEE